MCSGFIDSFAEFLVVYLSGFESDGYIWQSICNSNVVVLFVYSIRKPNDSPPLSSVPYPLYYGLKFSTIQINHGLLQGLERQHYTIIYQYELFIQSNCLFYIHSIPFYFLSELIFLSSRYYYQYYYYYILNIIITVSSLIPS